MKECLAESVVECRVKAVVVGFHVEDEDHPIPRYHMLLQLHPMLVAHLHSS